ncbi:hypothetical protein EUTSA_v10014143mg [Eutrema salsugineum]|uniref:TF-B3 domain-containing protein n=1 Tax=Eutrema salsugineum TaxID=72664 RepID=V4N801_EUTSA|nr:hypothetical protein EUTSA_v10014143mg [Eutrema salsugineum]
MTKNSCFGQIIEEGDNPGFFKVLRKEDLSTEIMRAIPHDFIRSISNKEFSFKMVLKLPWGSSWPIKISRNERFYYMEKSGWDKFLSDNDLGHDELLTFTHKGHMCFSVNIYQIDCKEILRPKKTATIASSSRNKREQGKNIYNDVKEEEIESLSESLSFPGSETDESTGRKLKQRRKINLGKKKVEEAEKTKKKKKNVDTDCDHSEAGTSSLVPKFTLTIKKSYLKFLAVRKKFADMHMPKETTMFKIHHSKEKRSWKVKYVVSDICESRFSPGWVRLAREFVLQVGDVCTFELIKPAEMVLSVTKKRQCDVCEMI